MTEQITIKLNKELFRPLIDELRDFGGHGITESDSDLVGKTLFFTYFFISRNQEPSGKTALESVLEFRKVEKAEAILRFLNDYYLFKKKGLAAYKKNKNNNNKKHHRKH
jgi:hypothetical protein